MHEWIKEHQKKLSLTLGVLLIIGAVASLFWSNVNHGVTDEEQRAAANVARMEARMNAKAGGSKQAPDKPLISSSYRQKQQDQLRYAMILSLVFGMGFVGYGVLKKEE